MTPLSRQIAEQYGTAKPAGDGYAFSARMKDGVLRTSISKEVQVPPRRVDAELAQIRAQCAEAANPNAMLLSEMGWLHKSELVALLIRGTTPEAVVDAKQDYIIGALTDRFLHEMEAGNLAVISLKKIRDYVDSLPSEPEDHARFQMHPKLKSQVATDSRKNEYIFYRPDHTKFADQLRESLGEPLTDMMPSIPRLLSASLRPEVRSNTIHIVGERLVGYPQIGYKQVPYDIEITEFKGAEALDAFNKKLRSGAFEVKPAEAHARLHVGAVAHEVFHKLRHQAEGQDPGEKEVFVLKAMAAFPTASAHHLHATTHMDLIRLMPKEMLARAIAEDPSRLPVLQEELALRHIAQHMHDDIKEAHRREWHTLRENFPQIALEPVHHPSVRLARRQEGKGASHLLVSTRDYHWREVSMDEAAQRALRKTEAKDTREGMMEAVDLINTGGASSKRVTAFLRQREKNEEKDGFSR
jgi:hypothetical protein